MYKYRDWVSFTTIIRKESHRFFRLWIQTMLPSAVTALLYFVIFGNLIGQHIGPMNGFSYMEYIIPGLIMMSVILNAYNNVVSSFYGAKFQRSIEEILVSPTPNSIILMGYMFGGILRGLIVGLVVILVAMFFAPVHIEHPILMLGVGFLTASLFSLAGFINSMFARSFDDIAIVPTFVLTPLIYLGGVFYSVDLLPPFWEKISLVNPILYMIDAFRYSMLGVSDIPIGLTISIIFGVTVLFYIIAFVLLTRGVGLRS